MKKSNVNEKEIQKININDVIVSETTKKLYDYSNRESEISSLMESISEHGQLHPIDVIKVGSKYPLLDGVLRHMAMIRLNLNEIDVIVHEFVETDEFTLSDLIIHHQIRKEKSVTEKLNEVKVLLRIDGDNRNPLRDKEKRVTLITSMLGGKGWGRNNVFSLENILLWEKQTNSTRRLAERVISNEIKINRALEIIRLIENPLFNEDKEKESGIVGGFLKGDYNAEKAVKLMEKLEEKKSEQHTVIKLHPVDRNNFTIIKGNIEEIELPEDLEIDTSFTSPPYYQLIKYGNDPNELGWEKTPDLYIKRLADILMKVYHRLKPTGSMFVNLGETYQNGECLGITDSLVVELRKRGVRYVDRLIWRKVSNKPNGNKIKRLTQGYETILHFSKTKDYYFERFRIKSSKKLKVSRGCKEKGSDKKSYHIPNNYDQFRNLLSEDEVTNILSVQINKNRTKHIEGEVEHPATFSSNLPGNTTVDINTEKQRRSCL